MIRIFISVICVFLAMLISAATIFYYIIKKAVKNGVLEALEDYNSDDDCEE